MRIRLLNLEEHRQGSDFSFSKDLAERFLSRLGWYGSPRFGFLPNWIWFLFIFYFILNLLYFLIFLVFGFFNRLVFSQFKNQTKPLVKFSSFTGLVFLAYTYK